MNKLVVYVLMALVLYAPIGWEAMPAVIEVQGPTAFEDAFLATAIEVQSTFRLFSHFETTSACQPVHFQRHLYLLVESFLI